MSILLSCAWLRMFGWHGYEEPQVLLDGRVRWLRTSKAPLHDQEGKVIGVLGTYEDMTDRKLAALRTHHSIAL
jgi:PAS domain S-box-containing protein